MRLSHECKCCLNQKELKWHTNRKKERHSNKFKAYVSFPVYNSFCKRISYFLLIFLLR